MVNEFVNYLNSMNSADANTVNSLAESQIGSNYFEPMLVERQVGHAVSELVSGEQAQCVILTGHAGDGKTTILIQVLGELGCISLSGNDKIAETSVYRIPSSGRELLCIKDMSELPLSTQREYFRQALVGPGKGVSSVVVSNTGPLMMVARDVGREFGEADPDAFEAELLERMDTNAMEPLTIGGYRCIVINAARLSNVDVAASLLGKMVDPVVWKPCDTCDAKDACHIVGNSAVVRRNLERVSAMIEALYEWWYEHDSRMTLRQMASHLSYALASNKTCAEVRKMSACRSSDYNFANAFFGYRGFRPLPEVEQLKAISELRAMGLDSKVLSNDYEVFAKPESLEVDDSLKPILSGLLREYHRLQNSPPSHSDSAKHSRANDLRKMIRRYYILFGISKSESFSTLLGDLFSPAFPMFRKAVRHGKEDPRLRDITLRALHTYFTGLPSDGVSELYLTVHRQENISQYVQLLHTSIKKKALIVKPRLCNTHSRLQDGDLGKYKLTMSIGQAQQAVSLPMLCYFWDTANGLISTRVSPSLSHGIEAFRSRLIAADIAENVTEDAVAERTREIEILYQTSAGCRVLSVSIDGTHLQAE